MAWGLAREEERKRCKLLERSKQVVNDGKEGWVTFTVGEVEQVDIQDVKTTSQHTQHITGGYAALLSGH